MASAAIDEFSVQGAQLLRTISQSRLPLDALTFGCRWRLVQRRVAQWPSQRSGHRALRRRPQLFRHMARRLRV